jgi:carbonic anhydrase/acetyltransferase-like protein (isoleucine patch superfamily)
VSIETLENLTPRVHPAAFIHSGAFLIGSVEVGEEASVWPAAVLRGDHGAIRIGARTSIQDGCVAHATQNHSETVIGAECTVGHRVVLHGCQVADHCLVGMGSVLLDLAELGEWCFLGAGALVTPGQKFPPRSFILGSPARRVREVTARERDWIVHSAQSYADLARQYLRERQLSTPAAPSR